VAAGSDDSVLAAFAASLPGDGRDAKGRAVHLTVDCSRFTEPVAEGG
jgi:hypothetical protein